MSHAVSPPARPFRTESRLSKTQRTCFFLPQLFPFFPNEFGEYCSPALPPAAADSASPGGVSIVRSWELEWIEGVFKIIDLECYPTSVRRGSTDGWVRMPASSLLTPGIRWIQAVGKRAAGEGLPAKEPREFFPWFAFWFTIKMTRDLCLSVTLTSEILAPLRRGLSPLLVPSGIALLDATAWLGISWEPGACPQQKAARIQVSQHHLLFSALPSGWVAGCLPLPEALRKVVSNFLHSDLRAPKQQLQLLPAASLTHS